ncbi:DUF2878 domain-containing protein [Thalassotalea sp. HSM 43]|uniref:DUF2878 domain-containing protein n=1 Tax=Thalassotalea sp. HSM 43 TaxID=2552945 RepID=UPI0010813F9A|nr:DUF2878 domain-containing protein [Thalassotalea sp. HSM 43]QBY03750.1 DUF2878 domain-containing protein [Thalassotalea sp. HSM 43]
MALILNSLVFNAIWLTAVLAKQPLLGFAMVVAWAYYPQPSRPQPIFVGLAFALGLLVDTLLVQTGFITFDNQVLPAYVLITLWAAFSYYCAIFFYYKTYTLWQLALLGVISGPSSYWAAAKLGAVSISWNMLPLTVLFLLFWAAVLPLYQALLRRLQCNSEILA